MNKSEKQYKDEIINKEDVLKGLITHDCKSTLFAVLLSDIFILVSWKSVRF